jgi:2,4-dienoyl-CoA reductase-like NADH-dependent reductase (Old Yellow Enzyme family)
MSNDKAFSTIRINGLEFQNRILRSSIGGRMAYHDGRVTPAWIDFERSFAEAGVGGIISMTFSVDEARSSPLFYPSIAHDKYIPDVKEGIRHITATGCRYILQIGDPGSHTQTSLFPEAADGKSASKGFDLLFGYRSFATAMTKPEIERSVRQFADAARRAKACGCDGIEITAAKGYLIHQFLNPGVNRRCDEYGGSLENRFRFLGEIVDAVRKEIGRDFPLIVRLSAEDRNYLPFNLRLPLTWPLRHWLYGNRVEDMIEIGRMLKARGVDCLHVTSGFGFINPLENHGHYPVEALRIFYNTTRHLSWKQWFVSTAINTFPAALQRWTIGLPWRIRKGVNADYAARFRREVGLPVIVNGGVQSREDLDALIPDKADMVAMARPLLANRDLVQRLRDDAFEDFKPCCYCNKCIVLTAVLPVGCYDLKRFDSHKQMSEQIMALNSPVPAMPMSGIGRTIRLQRSG